LDNPFSKIHSARAIVSHLFLKAGMIVVDVGCGPGRLSIPIAEQVGPTGEVVAVDIQPQMLHRAQEKALGRSLTNIRFIQMGIGQGKLEHNYYDRALLVTVLGEIPDRQVALQEVFDSLKPGGILSVTEIIFDPHFQKRSTVRQLTGKIGFQEKDFFGNRFTFTLNFAKPVGALTRRSPQKTTGFRIKRSTS
jgi:Methylase involved in ubiquinone/menaquinone biosynthesis